MFRQKQVGLDRRFLVWVALVAALVACTSCSPVGDVGSESMKASHVDQPIFSTQEDALNAATKTYQRYFEVSDQIASRGGAGREDMTALATPDFLVVTDQGFEEIAANSLHTRGRTSVESVSLQSLRERDGRAEVMIYACVDVTNVAVLNSVGEVVTSPDRPNRLSLVAELISDTQASSNLVLSKNVPWSGDSFC
jgi:hypothetical protein